MSYKEELLKEIHKLFREDKWINDLFESVGERIDLLSENVEDLAAQMLFDTATWALDIYESELNISNQDKNYEDRRAEVISKNRSEGKINLQVLQDIAGSYSDGVVNVSFKNGEFDITFVEKSGLPRDIEAFYNAFENAKPAHLGLNSTLAYSQALKKLYAGVAYQMGKIVEYETTAVTTEFTFLIDEHDMSITDGEYGIFVEE